MSPAARSESNWKIPYLETEISASRHPIPFFALVETWLQPHITDSQVEIKDYCVLRTDRKPTERTKNGGVALYIHNTLSYTHTVHFDTCDIQLVMTYINSEKLIIGSVYKYKSTTENFKKLLKFMKDYIENINESANVLIMGDFNFPQIKWPEGYIKTGQPSNGNTSAHHLLEFIHEQLLKQYVEIPTRLNNTLDLIFSNNNELVHHVSTTETILLL